MQNNMFKDIKSYEYKDLHGKTLEISIVDNEEITIIAGKDIEDDKVYILNYEVKENEV